MENLNKHFAKSIKKMISHLPLQIFKLKVRDLMEQRENSLTDLKNKICL